MQLRPVKCEDCGHIWESGAKPQNLKCKKCKSVNVTDNYVDPDATVIEKDAVKTCGDCKDLETRCDNRTADDEVCNDFDPKLSEEDDLEAANKAAEEAAEVADKAISTANAAAAFAKSKEPLPCSRCGGDGEWHSNKTGVRAKTSSEPLHDPTRPCPECK